MVCSSVFHRRSCSAVAIALLVLASKSAVAATISMTYAGVTTSSNASLPALSVGTAISMTYTFDSAAVDTNAAANTGRYALTGMAVNVGGNAFTASPVATSYIQIDNNAGGSYDDFYLVSSGSDPLVGPSINGATLTQAVADLIDYEAGQFISDDLLLQPQPLSQFERKRFWLDFNLNPGTATIIGVINSWTLNASPVPIPAAAWLFGGALAGLGVLRRRPAVS